MGLLTGAGRGAAGHYTTQMMRLPTMVAPISQSRRGQTMSRISARRTGICWPRSVPRERQERRGRRVRQEQREQLVQLVQRGRRGRRGRRSFVWSLAAYRRPNLPGIASDQFAERPITDPKRRLVAVVDHGQGEALAQLLRDRLQPGQNGNPTNAPGLSRTLVSHAPPVGLAGSDQ